MRCTTAEHPPEAVGPPICRHHELAHAGAVSRGYTCVDLPDARPTERARATPQGGSSGHPVEVLGQSRVVAKPNLECHAAFEHPQTRLGDLQPGENPLEEHPSSQPIEADPGALRPSEEHAHKRSGWAASDGTMGVAGGR